jgi:hypothetical protein
MLSGPATATLLAANTTDPWGRLPTSFVAANTTDRWGRLPASFVAANTPPLLQLPAAAKPRRTPHTPALTGGSTPPPMFDIMPLSDARSQRPSSRVPSGRWRRNNGSLCQLGFVCRPRGTMAGTPLSPTVNPAPTRPLTPCAAGGNCTRIPPAAHSIPAHPPIKSPFLTTPHRSGRTISPTPDC